MSENKVVRAIHTGSEQQTINFGRHFARCLRPGDVVTLDGPLGVGKTRIAAGIAMEFGLSRDDVTSPTFTLIHEYPTDPPVAHLDAYRLVDSDEFLNLGVSELWEDGIVIVEWGSKVVDALPKGTIAITGRATSDTGREWEISTTPTWMDQHQQTLSCFDETYEQQ